MPYVGNKPEVGNFRKCDAITTSATATFNLLVGGVAVNPNQNQCIVSLNGVIQSSGNSYTIASSQITFASTLASSDVIDFILILGDTLDVGVPSDDTVDASKITANVITGQSALGATPADTDELLISDAGVLKRVDYSHIKGGTNTPAFMANLGSGQSIANDTTTKVNMDTEIYDTDSKYDTSNYRFTPGVAGKYLVFAQIMYTAYAADGTAAGLLVKKNGSTVQESYERSAYGSNFDFYIHITTSVILDDDDYIEIFTRQGSGGAKTAYQGALYSFWGASKLIGA